MDFKENISEAYERIKRDIKRTSLEYSSSLSQRLGAEVYLKWENEQLTGSFKIRGALNKIRFLSMDQKRRGIVSASTGNHGLGLSYACQLERVGLTLFLPTTASEEKSKKLSELNVSLILHGSSCEKAELHARRIAQETDRVYISPYNDWDIVFGQGTVGFEILEDLPDVDDVIVPVGGGGLISGIAGYLKYIHPKIRIFGVEPENSQFMAASIKARRIVEIEEKETLADAVAGGIEPGSITFPLCQKYVEEFLTVEESLIKSSMSLLFEEHQKIVEGAGALSLSGLMRACKTFKGRKVVLVVSGGNISQGTFNKIIHV